MIASNLPGGSPKFSKSPLPRKERRMAGRKMGESECFATAASRKVQVFLKRFTDPRAPIPPARSRRRRPAGLAGGRLFTYANFPPQKFSLNAKFLTDGPLIFSAPLSQNAAAPRNKKCVFETRMSNYGWIAGRVLMFAIKRHRGLFANFYSEVIKASH